MQDFGDLPFRRRHAMGLGLHDPSQAMHGERPTFAVYIEIGDVLSATQLPPPPSLSDDSGFVIK